MVAHVARRTARKVDYRLPLGGRPAIDAMTLRQTTRFGTTTHAALLAAPVLRPSIRPAVVLIRIAILLGGTSG
jgi:hypothetical protein